MRRHTTGDEGAYAILYALLLTVVVAVAAVVVDLGALRQSRRQTRLASDSAAVASALFLDPLASGGSRPRDACTKAWSYLGTNLGFTATAASVAGWCAAFPPDYDPATTACPAAIPSTGTVGDFTVTITWPVADGSALMTPNVNPATATQAVDPDVDGTDPCARLAVSVAQRQQPSFATIFGATATTTSVTSVARAATSSGPGTPIAALNVLNRTACQTLVTSGLAAIRVDSVVDAVLGPRPGIIAIESSGAGCGPKTVIDVQGGNSSVRADGPGAAGAGRGVILSWAMNPFPTGNPTRAYNTTDPSKLAPTPTLLGARSGSTPVTNIYGCASGCSASYITALRAAYGGTTIPTTGYAGSPFPYDAPVYTPFTTCNVNSTIVMPPGNYYIDCASLDVKGTLVFKGGNVISRGGINVSTGSGCFAVNVPVTSAACPTVTSGEVTTKPLTESILYLQNGNLSRNGGSFYAANTFTYLANGRLDLGGNEGTVLMTNPRLDIVPAGCATACQNARFWKLALWSESSADQVIGGQGSLYLRGVLFVPKSKFDYGGQADQAQVGAQFWADTINDSGQGTLRMAPDPNDSVPTPLLSVRLIR